MGDSESPRKHNGECVDECVSREAKRTWKIHPEWDSTIPWPPVLYSTGRIKLAEHEHLPFLHLTKGTT